MIEIKNFNNLSESELWQIKKLWNDEVGFIYPLDDKVFNHHVINSKFLVKNASFIAFLQDVPIGFIIAKTFDTGEISAYRDRSWISLFYVSKRYRKQGAGNLLLEKCLNELKLLGKKECFIGQDIGNFFPGVPCDFDALTENFLSKREFKSFGCTHDLILKNKDMIKDIDNSNFRYEYRFLNVNSDNEKKSLLSFMERNFPGRWTYELNEYLKNETMFNNYYLAFDKEKVIGFVRVNEPKNENVSYNITWANRFNNLVGIGPLGIDIDYRGKDISKEMMDSILKEIALNNRDILIDWTSLLAYYQQYGFEVWKVYTKMKLDFID